jgi:hypothetical protein
MSLVTRPRLVILDEPTSGLDSYTAICLVRAAVEIAAHNRIVVMSLHQPSREIFGSLSRVLLLANGRTAYSGPPDAVARTFAAAGLPLPAGAAPAEHMLSVVSRPASLAALLRHSAAAGTGVFVGSSNGSPNGKGGVNGGVNGVNGGPVQRKGSSSSSNWDDTGVNPRAAGDQGGVVVTNPAAAAAVADEAGCVIDVHAGQRQPGGGRVSGSSLGSSELLEAAAAAGAAAAGGGAGASGSSGGSDLGSSSSSGALAALGNSGGGGGGGGAAARVREWAGAQRRECSVLFWRAFVNIRREPRLLLLHWLVAVVLGIVVGLIFFQLGSTQVRFTTLLRWICRVCGSNAGRGLC